ncbi:unnamed protein product, partial [marine sediment metagenome]
VRTYYRGKKKETDILDTIYLHFQMRAASIPKKTKFSEIEIAESSEFGKQVKKERENYFRGRREIASIF